MISKKLQEVLKVIKKPVSISGYGLVEVHVQSISSWLSKNRDENPRMRTLGREF